MTVCHHPDASTLMSYSAGSLSEALSAVVACHLELCADCRREVHRLNRIGGAMLTAAEHVPMSKGSFEALMARLDNEAVETGLGSQHRPAMTDSEVPVALQAFVGTSFADAPWRRLGPGVRHIRLPLSSKSTGDLRLLRIAPGQMMPDHGHGGAEMTLVLKGSYDDRMGHFARGDVADLNDDTEHQPIVTPDAECICLIAAEGKMRVKSMLGRILQPLIGM